MRDQQRMRQRLWRSPTRRRVAGQSIPLIALMIVVLVGMVGLSVDVGNNYAEQRQIVRATNAASRVAMQSYIDGATDGDISRNIEAALRANGVEPIRMEEKAASELAYNERRWEAYYMDAKGNRILTCPIGTCTQRPGGASYIEVSTDGLVDTYFARVVGAETLPVNADAFSGVCPPVQGVFPIGVKLATIGDASAQPPRFQDFGGNAPSQIYIPDVDETYSMLRLYIGRGDPYNANVGAGFLRWLSGYTVSDLPAMLEGDGNLDMGFNEVTPWPVAPGSGGMQPPTINGEIVYPYQPGYLQQGDWVFGIDPSEIDLGAIAGQLEQHRLSRTQLVLPIFTGPVPNSTDPQGAKPTFYVSQFGKFYLIGYGQDAERNNANYLDLALHSLDPVVPCPAKNIDNPPSFGLVGSVSLQGVFGERDRSSKPSGYTVVLDVSGSMSWNFAGLGSRSGVDYQCEMYDPNSPYDFGPRVFGDCGGGPNVYWREREDRRIYAAREAIINIIDRMDPNDRIRFVTFSSSVEAVSPEWYAPTDPRLPTIVRTIAQCCGGTQENPSYLTDGGTNGVLALDRARQLINDANFPREATGEQRELRRVILYMTDGVSRGLMNGTEVNREECDIFRQSGTAEDRSKLINTAWCFIGTRGSTVLSISQMQIQSAEMHQTMYRDGHDDFRLYVLAMGNTEFIAGGLGQVATTPGDLFRANEASKVEALLEQIRNQVQFGECQVQRSDDIVTRIEGQHVPDGVDELSEGVYGFVTIRQNGEPIPNMPYGMLPIVHGEDGKLSFSLPPDNGLVPGTYELEARVWYNAGGEANGTRKYDKIVDPTTNELVERMTFTVAPTLGDTYRVPNVHLNLDPTIYSPPNENRLCEGS